MMTQKHWYSDISFLSNFSDFSLPLYLSSSISLLISIYLSHSFSLNLSPSFPFCFSSSKLSSSSALLQLSHEVPLYMYVRFSLPIHIRGWYSYLVLFPLVLQQKSAHGVIIFSHYSFNSLYRNARRTFTFWLTHSFFNMIWYY